jgi:hypothetical protein
MLTTENLDDVQAAFALMEGVTHAAGMTARLRADLENLAGEPMGEYGWITLRGAGGWHRYYVRDHCIDFSAGHCHSGEPCVLARHCADAEALGFRIHR